MTPEMLRESALGQGPPPEGLAGPLTALWWAARGDWTQAHAAAQAGEDGASAWVHAYLHRVEGDISNADYWYRRAGRTRPSVALDAEWTIIAAGISGAGVAAPQLDRRLPGAPVVKERAAPGADGVDHARDQSGE